MALRCSICSLTTSTLSWGTSRPAPLRPLAPPALSCPAPLRKLNSSCVDCSPDRAHAATIITLLTHTSTQRLTHTHLFHTFYIHLVGTMERLRLKGLLKEGVIEKELANYMKMCNGSSNKRRRSCPWWIVLGAKIVWHNVSLDFNLL